MRRSAFYLLIGLATFVIGLFAAFGICFRPDEKPSITQTLERIEPEEKSSKVIETTPNPAAEEINYEEQVAFIVLKPTIRRWLSGAPIKSVFTEPSDESIKEITGVEWSEIEERDAGWLQGFRFEPTSMDFNGDGVHELAIRNLCAPVGNCNFTVLEKQGKSYQIILESDAGAVQTFTLERTKSNGYFDIKTTAHGDAWSGGIEIYKFDGKKYQVAECFNYDYAALVNGKHTVWKKPRITPRKCVEE